MDAPDLVQVAFTETLKGLIATGRAPHYVELARGLGVSPDEARRLQHQAAEVANREGAAACWMAADTDYVEAWAPFSSLPTQHRITIEGHQKWFAQ